MNLVIDDAVEVRLPTKTEEEKRRSLGMEVFTSRTSRVICAKGFRHRANTAEG